MFACPLSANPKDLLLPVYLCRRPSARTAPHRPSRGNTKASKCVQLAGDKMYIFCIAVLIFYCVPTYRSLLLPTHIPGVAASESLWVKLIYKQIKCKIRFATHSLIVLSVAGCASNPQYLHFQRRCTESRVSHSPEQKCILIWVSH